MVMPDLGESLLIVALMTLVLGVVILIRPLRELGLERRRDGVIAVTVSIFLFVLAAGMEEGAVAEGGPAELLRAASEPAQEETGTTPPPRVDTPTSARPEGRTGPLTTPCIDLC